MCDHLQPFCLEAFIKVTENSSPRCWSCTICRMPCHRLIYDHFVESAFQSLSNSQQDFIYFREDGSFSKESLLEFKSKQNPATPIEEETTIHVQDFVASEDEVMKQQKLEVTVERYEQSNDLNLEAVAFFRNLLRENSTKESLSNLCQTLVEILNLDQKEVIEEVHKFNL